MKHIINLTFHGIGNRTRLVENGEGNYWINKDLFVNILNSVQCLSNVCITFDDGNISDFDIAFPELLKRRMVGKFFILTGMMNVNGYLSAKHIREISSYGMEVGIHGKNHIKWRGLSGDQLKSEIIDSKKKLEDIVCKPIISSSCPFGEYDSLVLKKLVNANYKYIYTSDRVPCLKNSWFRPRYSVRSKDNIDSIMKNINQKHIIVNNFFKIIKICIKMKR